MHQGHQGREPISGELDRIGRRVVHAALTVHRALGPGLLESVYEHCLAQELAQEGLRVARQVGVPVTYSGARLEVGFRIDLLVQNEVVVEVKAVETLAPVHTAQVLTYLRFAERRLGYLINFNTVLLKDGVRRLVL